MKIAQVVSTFPPDIGGMGQVALGEALGLSSAGHEVVVYTLKSRLSEYNDKHFTFKVVRKSSLLQTSAAGYWPELRKELKNFDLVHLHFPFYGSAEWVWLQSTPYVVTYHMDAFPQKAYQKMIQSVYDRLITPNLFKKAKRVILVDELHNYKFKKILHPGQEVVLPNGVDTDIFRPLMVEPYDLGYPELNGKKILVFVGNLLPIKGMPLLLEAVASIENPDLRLLVIGGGYQENSYRKLADRLGISKKIIWHGPCFEQMELAKYYGISCGVVVPSMSETFSLVAAEAMSCGKPVIASDLPGMKRRVLDGETGFLFEKGSVKSLTEKINKLLVMNRKEAEKMGENGRALVSKEFSLGKHVQDLGSIYKEIV